VGSLLKLQGRMGVFSRKRGKKLEGDEKNLGNCLVKI
jgi:hypothetical protein